jgi:hypothetical protein
VGVVADRPLRPISFLKFLFSCGFRCSVSSAGVVVPDGAVVLLFLEAFAMSQPAITRRTDHPFLGTRNSKTISLLRKKIENYRIEDMEGSASNPICLDEYICSVDVDPGGGEVEFGLASVTTQPSQIDRMEWSGEEGWAQQTVCTVGELVAWLQAVQSLSAGDSCLWNRQVTFPARCAGNLVG